MSMRHGGTLRSSFGALERVQAALAERWARPRKLAIGAFLFFAVAFVSLFSTVAAIAIVATALNGVVTLACASALATAERWTPRIASGQAPLLERTLQFASLMWLYAGVVFVVFSVGERT